MLVIFKPGKQERQNTSRVREHLSNERTYLAWMRTAIALMGFGVVIVRLSVLHPTIAYSSGNSWNLGLLFCVIGLITVLLSTIHYFTVLRHIESNSDESTGRWVILFSIVVTLLGAGVIYFVFTAPVSPINSVMPTR